ncbi:MAG: pilin [Clostridia bacterium]
MNFLTIIASKMLSFMGGTSMLGADDGTGKKPIAEWTWVTSLTTAMRNILAPILGVVAAAGCIYAIVIGIKMARADSGEKREEAKKRLISVIVAVAVVAILILFFVWLFPMIMEQITGYKPTTPKV